MSCSCIEWRFNRSQPVEANQTRRNRAWRTLPFQKRVRWGWGSTQSHYNRIKRQLSSLYCSSHEPRILLRSFEGQKQRFVSLRLNLSCIFRYWWESTVEPRLGYRFSLRHVSFPQSRPHSKNTTHEILGKWSHRSSSYRQLHFLHTPKENGTVNLHQNT
jgi:hypothetical protein